MAAKAHARLSASSADRWMNCPGSIRMSAGIEEAPSTFAAEGTAAHALAEHCLRHGFLADRFLGWWVDPNPGEGMLAVGKSHLVGAFEVTEEMAEAVQVYLDYARSIIKPGDEWELEQTLDHLSRYHPDFGGTADLTVYKPEEKHLIVIDYKHGRGVAVEVPNNPQLLKYAFGAATRMHNRQLEKVTIVVVQPRCPHPAGPVRSWTVDAVDLLDFAADLVAAAKRTEDPDAPLVPGDWCKFCKAAAVCPALRNKVNESAMADFSEAGELTVADPATYDAATLARTLREVDLIEDWCKSVRNFAHHEAEAGRTVPGFKLVATRALRKWKNEDDALIDLRLNHDMQDEHIYTEPKMHSPAQIEAQLKKHYGLKGKKATEAIADLVEKVSSGTVLAPLDDPREPVKPEAEAEFGTVAQ